jgi:hypothetical protein
MRAPELMGHVILPPSAAALMQSFRGIGYDVKTAIADLIDNSIAAGASTVWLAFHWDGQNSYVKIRDNGLGMSQKSLDAAMTLGVGGPALTRAANDLGRFGLGLKTASFSQCKRLTVVSKVAGGTNAIRVWDLEEVVARNEWIAGDALDVCEVHEALGLKSLESGTVVIWRTLDRMVGDADVDDVFRRGDFQKSAEAVSAHLAMVFHRYLEGVRPRLRIFVNGEEDDARVRPWDPYCQWHPSTQGQPETRRSSVGGGIVLQGFVLPHKDRFEGDGFEKAGGPSGWTAQQGFYIYRNERLLVAGSWLGLGDGRRWTRDEQHKLARIRIDIPNTMDAAWAIDVKKAAARPPIELKPWLTKNATVIREKARKVFVHRGRKIGTEMQVTQSPVWKAEQGPAPRYSINREHPMVASLLSAGGEKGRAVEEVLRVLEATVPIHRIWLDVSEKPEVSASPKTRLPESDVLGLAGALLAGFMANGKTDRASALRLLRSTEPFDQYPDVLSQLESEKA